MNWQIFKAIFELYERGYTKKRASLVDHHFIKYHSLQTKELFIGRNQIELTLGKTFRSRFEHLYLQKYRDCQDLLNAIGENKPQCRLDTDDILILKDMKARMDSGELHEIRNQIIESKETRRGVSLMFFKHEKHLDGSEALERAVKTILQIDSFPDDRDAQYLYVLHCKHPRLIILCENLHFLKMPEIPRKNNFELWYAGGKNIEKLNHIPDVSLPLYYIGDWDHDGLAIYQAVKKMLPNIELLTPNGEPKSIVQTEHKSLWEYPDNPSFLSGFSYQLFSDTQRGLIESLIRNNSWIIEESNDLLRVIPF